MKDLKLEIINNIRMLDTAGPESIAVMEILEQLNERISKLTGWTKEALDKIRDDIQELKDSE